ncbi:MAG: hypothetical protein JXR41_11515 [Bacteroidales bacterium]|nr:hypothetical protein [Bacteroidales bacterium]MBN2763710.1 hypothetical protein [Bacteroidales bacterium]
MKYAIILCLLLSPVITCRMVSAQEDSIKIQQINVHTIAKGKQTPEYFTKNQKTLTMDEHIIREINFNDSTKQVEDYTFYFYRDGKLFTEEKYDSDNVLQNIIKHDYDVKGQRTESTTLTLSGGKLIQSAKTVYSYDNNGNKTSKKDYRTGKKPYRTTVYTYSSNLLINEQSKAKKSMEHIIRRIVNYQYDTDGKLKTKSVFEKDVKTGDSRKNELYLYNINGKLEKVEIRDAQDSVLLVKNYEYYPGGALYRYFEQTGEGNVLCYYTYAYRKHRINLGEQKSYFDNQ